jgi:hypothetical protein
MKVEIKCNCGTTLKVEDDWSPHVFKVVDNFNEDHKLCGRPQVMYNPPPMIDCTNQGLGGTGINVY